jgi:hypothetical protein
MLEKTKTGPEKTPEKKVMVVIAPQKIATALATIIGNAPYLQNKFSSENREKMMETQKAGSAVKKTRKAKPPKDFEKVYQSSIHYSTEGWIGIPCAAIRGAMLDACSLTEVEQKRFKMCVRIIEQGYDSETEEGLVKIIGEPEMKTDRVKIGINTTDIAARAMFRKWSSTFEIQWDDDFFKAQDVFNLLARAGWQVGIGAGRPLSKSSAGTGKGTFKVESANVDQG